MVPFKVKFSAGESIFDQVCFAAIKSILAGELKAGESFPSVRALALDLKIHPNARIYVLPCIAGHVGADTAGVVLSEEPHESDDNMLVVDVGTNAEIVLGSKRRLLACSSPTGPAFTIDPRSRSV